MKWFQTLSIKGDFLSINNLSIIYLILKYYSECFQIYASIDGMRYSDVMKDLEVCH